MNQSNSNSSNEKKSLAPFKAIAAIIGSSLGTLSTHWLNNYYTLLSLDGGSISKSFNQVKHNKSLLFKGLPETVVMRCFSQGGSIAIQSHLSSTGMDNILACAIGGTWDAFICTAVDVNNVTKITNGKLTSLHEAFRLGMRVLPIMLARDIPNLILGRIFGTRLSCYIFSKDHEELNTLDRFIGSFMVLSLFQIYAGPATAATTKLINNPNTTVLHAIHTVIVKERNQLPQRISSRMVLVAARNSIAYTVTDNLLNILTR